MFMHNVNMAAPISEFVVSLSSDGQILSQGLISDALARNSKLKAEVAQEKKKEEKTEWEMDAKQEAEMLQEDGKLIVKEESSEGHISWGFGKSSSLPVFQCVIVMLNIMLITVKMYLVTLGGRYWMIFQPAFTFATVFKCGIEVLQPWLLGAWATEYSIHLDPADMDVTL
ncbi:hypothetical protein C0989_011828 [Termitomyces sp. Mn162]|nr:hypothetical protein C0989_011828 [Termitomyces sp. Mn162]